MNIAFYTHYFTPEIGAPSARVYDLSQRWLEDGDQVDVITCFPNHPHGEIYPNYKLQRYQQEQLDGIRVHRNWTYIAANRGFIKKTLGHVSFWNSARLNTDRKLGDFDLAIGTSPTFFAAMAAASAAKRRNVPFIMEVRDLWPAIFVELGVITNRQIIRLLEQWEMWMYRQASKIITVTKAFEADLIERGIPAHKVHTIPNGANMQFWQPKARPLALREKLGLQDKFVVLYIGTHGISQALHSVLDAANLLQDAPDVHFLFVGAGADKAKLIEQAQAERLTNVTFHDPVKKDEVADFYALCDVALIPLRDIPLFETFIPSKMFEVMAMERPIIGSVRGESAEILRASNSAAIVDPENGAQLAAAVRELAAQPERLAEMGKAGRQFVADHYSRRAHATQYKAIMQEAIEEFGR